MINNFQYFLFTGLIFSISLTLSFSEVENTWVYGSTTNETSLSLNNINSMEWTTYSNSEIGFSIEYPQNYIVTEEKSPVFVNGYNVNFESPYPINSPKYQILQIIVIPTSSSFVDAKGLAETIKDASTNIQIPEINSRIVEDISTNKYVIDGEQAASFTYIEEFPSVPDIPTSIVEVIVVVHNNTAYQFGFGDNGYNIENKEVDSIKEHMINSIKWIP